MIIGGTRCKKGLVAPVYWACVNCNNSCSTNQIAAFHLFAYLAHNVYKNGCSVCEVRWREGRKGNYKLKLGYAHFKSERLNVITWTKILINSKFNYIPAAQVQYTDTTRPFYSERHP